jgi:uncharacterized membrane protein
MATPEPSLHPWYQFSLRSLMLFVLFVSLLFSLGACIHGLACVTIAFGVVIGGIVGRIVAGTWLGFVLGSMFGVQFSLIAVVVCVYLALSGSTNLEGTALWAALGTAALIGGVLGGLIARPCSER